jgi:hypothetical protein
MSNSIGRILPLPPWGGRARPTPKIAAVLDSTEQVTKNQLRSVFDKLGVWSRLELALYVASHGGARWTEGTQIQISDPEVPRMKAQSA